MTQRSHAILLIEDDLDIRETLASFLEEEGYRVIQAENGRDGLKKLETAPKPCLILLDLFMPVMNGVEFLSRLKGAEDVAIASSPVILVSAAPPGAEEVKRARPMASGFIKKPMALEAVLRIIDDVCTGAC